MHAVLNTIILVLRKVSRGRILPENYAQREDWQGFDPDGSIFQPLIKIGGFFRIQEALDSQDRKGGGSDPALVVGPTQVSGNGVERHPDMYHPAKPTGNEKTEEV